MSRLESGLTFESFSGSDRRNSLRADLRYGILNNLDFEVEVPYLSVSAGGVEDSGLGDLSLKLKVRILKGREANPLSIGGKIAVKFPTCNEASLGQAVFPSINPSCTGESDISLIGIATKEFSLATVHLNAGYTLVGNPPFQALDDEVLASVGVDYPTVIKPLRVAGELSAVSNRYPGVGDAWSLLLASSYAFNPALIGDLSFLLGLGDPAPDYAMSLGITHHF